jgi:hypothetical protein
MGIDMLGALFSILSLLFRTKLDVPAVVSVAFPYSLRSSSSTRTALSIPPRRD